MFKFTWNDRPRFRHLGGIRSELQMRRYAMILRLPTHCIGMDGAHEPPIRWSIDDQAWAVDQGFFVQLCADDLYQRPIIISMDDVDLMWPRNKRECNPDISYTKPRKTVLAIRRRALEGDALYMRLVKFIYQQDAYGYFNAWEPRVRYYSRPLFWYKELRGGHISTMKQRPTDDQIVNAFLTKGSKVFRFPGPKPKRATIVQGVPREARPDLSDAVLPEDRVLTEHELDEACRRARLSRAPLPALPLGRALDTGV